MATRAAITTASRLPHHPKVLPNANAMTSVPLSSCSPAEETQRLVAATQPPLRKRSRPVGFASPPHGGFAFVNHYLYRHKGRETLVEAVGGSPKHKGKGRSPEGLLLRLPLPLKGYKWTRDTDRERRYVSDKIQRWLTTALATVITMVLSSMVTHRFLKEELPERRGIKDDAWEAVLEGGNHAVSIILASVAIRRIFARR